MRPLSRDVVLSRHLTFAPLEVVDLGDLEVGGVGGEQTRGRWAGGSQAELGVDVEGEIGTTLGPDFRLDEEVIGDEVIPARGTFPGGLQGGLQIFVSVASNLCEYVKAYLGGLSGEVVGGELLAGDSFIEGLESTIIGREERELPTVGIVDIEVNLTILATIGWKCSGTD